MVSGMSVLLTANNFSFAEFPLYRALGPDRSPEKMLKVLGLGVMQVGMVYVCSAIFAIYLFGSSIQTSVLENFQT